ncbi:GNAT family N-acetyltransferase [Geodermatophilus sp. DSM 44513]|uniref:GNAT family N-acetyltransferase n=1 Tax=Geodermatophilus sp. DSM 44513 TaxID=1528104 RepID=UPI0012826215|nr:GNAT family N-acetyltransferase [Geodermatophilus sp. DSM 44513]WNV77536.1 GNAT family N-acetyltransferase [Geodermatophilus sp. DSM 44513]
MSAGVTVRLVAPGDVAPLTALLVANRDHLAPWDPVRAPEYWTEQGQRVNTDRLLDLYELGGVLPGVVLLDGEVVGQVTVNNVVRGAFRSGDLGYWVSHHVTGRGVATAAVAATARWAFGDAGLHRLQAGTLLHNAASQTVLRRNGFTPIGVAPGYLCIAGRWQDHLLFQLLDGPGMR